MLLALDDTDGPHGGCTTHVAARIVQRIGPGHLDGLPRLVRLDPSTPYKTRGNAAVAIPLGPEVDPDMALAQAQGIVQMHARVADGKGAGLALLPEAPDGTWYERGVREQIPLEEAQRALQEARTFTLGTGRGLIGALCAAAWDPRERSHTFTRIAYRAEHRHGTPREIAPAAARMLDRREATFDCWDPHDEHAPLAPRTPCPVLYGVRATTPSELDASMTRLTEEPEILATTFITNQATDDHIPPQDIQVVQVTGTPRTLKGGHVHAPAKSPDGSTLDVLAYEPTGSLRNPIRELRAGDHLVPLGGGPSGQINLEKALLLPREQDTPTRCPACGGRMGSTGQGAPRRCPRCGALATPSSQAPHACWVEADPSARRHLARPLELGLAPHVEDAVQAALAHSSLPQAPPRLP